MQGLTWPCSAHMAHFNPHWTARLSYGHMWTTSDICPFCAVPVFWWLCFSRGPRPARSRRGRGCVTSLQLCCPSSGGTASGDRHFRLDGKRESDNLPGKRPFRTAWRQLRRARWPERSVRFPPRPGSAWRVHADTEDLLFSVNGGHRALNAIPTVGNRGIAGLDAVNYCGWLRLASGRPCAPPNAASRIPTAEYQ